MRLHRVFLRLNDLEWLLARLLTLVGLWTPLLQPPSNAELMQQPDESDEDDGLAPLHAEAAPRAASFLYPSSWDPASFRKPIIIVSKQHKRGARCSSEGAAVSPFVAHRGSLAGFLLS